MSHMRFVARDRPLLQSALHFIDSVRHPETRRQRQFFQALAELQRALDPPTDLRASTQLLIADGHVWIGSVDAWFVVTSSTWALLTEDFERIEMEEMARRVPPDGRFLDVGANFGLHAVGLAKRHPMLKVDAFEPVPESLALLRLNASKNDCDRLVVHPFAVADFDGEAMITSEFGTGNHLVPAARAMVTPRATRVPCTTLDSFWEREGRPRVDLVKVDVEGAEWAVLRGGRTFFAQHPPLLIELVPEWLSRFDRRVEECIDLLSASGYTHGRPIGAGRDGPWSRLASVPIGNGGNFLFTAEATETNSP